MRSFSFPDFVRTHRRTLVVIVGIMLIPLIYAGSLIWSNEDPTHRLDHINAAIVNSDQAATPATTTDGEPAEPVDLGATLTEKLVDSTESNNFSWHEMSADEAQSALESGQVLAVLDIPAGFSAAAVSAGGDDPLDAAIARLSITTNDGANIIVGNIASTVGTTVADELAAEVSDEYLRNVYVGFTDIHESVSEAADGATDLNDGAEQARTGSGELVVGLGQLREGGLALADGSATLADGATQVDAGVQQLNTGLVTANSGAQQLSSGAADANTGAQQLSAGAASANGGAQELSTGLSQLNAATSELPTSLTDLSDGVASLSEGATTLSSGAASLATGSRSVANGSAKLSTGADEAFAGAQQLDAGSGTLATGATQVSSGIDSLAANYDSLTEAQRKQALAELSVAAQQVDEGAGTLHESASALVGSVEGGSGLAALQAGATELASGADSAATGAESLQSGAADLATGAETLASGVSPLGDKLNELVTAISTASSGASTLATGTQSLADGAATLATGTQSLADGASTLATGTQTLSAGASTLAQSTPQLASGATQLEQGATTLADGTADAESGGTELNDGITQLADGSKTLADGLDDGVSDIPSYTDAQADHLAGVTSTPVEITKTRLNEVPAYGYGLAPYFMTLGLWVGALAFYLMFPPLRERLVLGRQPAFVVALRSFAPGAMLGAAQSLLMLTIVRFGLGLEPANMLGLVALALLTSVTFVAVNQAFNALLGPPGRFLALVMIVLQLSSAGGTYPVETAPAFFQLIHSWLPLNYAVTAFRSLVAGGSIGIGEAYGMLTVWLVAALALTTLSIELKRRRERLAPAAGPASRGPAEVSPLAAEVAAR